MSSKKVGSIGTVPAHRIAALRKALQLSQEEFAAKMGVGRIAALYWENGRSQPSADTYVRMAKLATTVDEESSIWFWSQVGVDLETLKGLFPEFNRSAKKNQQRLLEATEDASSDVAVVPLLRDSKSIGSPTTASTDQIEAWLPVAKCLVPNPSKTSCLRDPRRLTVLGGSDLFLVDSSPLQIDTPWSQMVVAECRSRAAVYAAYLSRLEVNGKFVPLLSAARGGFDARRTSQVRSSEAEVDKEQRQLRSASGLQRLPFPLVMKPDADWKIVGRVICRISCVPGIGLEPVK